MAISNREVYAVSNYITAIVLILSPWIFNYTLLSSDLFFPLITGALIIICNLCTQWKFSIWEKINIHHRLMIDFAVSCFLMLYPKLISYEGYVFITPYVWIGLTKLLFVLCSIELINNETIIAPTRKQTIGFRSFIAEVTTLKKSISRRGASMN